MAKPKARKNSAKPPAVPTAAPPATPDICFVIMPFGGWLDDYYESIYRPAIEAAGLEPHRADDLYRPSTIVNDIWAYTRRAKVLVADLTGKNPNVFYELGLAHAIAKPAILVAETMNDIPFDLRALRVITYEKNDPRWGERLQNKVEAAIKEVLKSPQEAVLPAFLHVRPAPGAPEVTPQQKDLIEIRQDIDLLRREVRQVPQGLRFREDIGSPDDVLRIGPDEALRLIRAFVSAGLSQDRIIEDLVRRGAPPGWVIGEVVRLLASDRQRKAPDAPSDSASRRSSPSAAASEGVALRSAKPLAQQASSAAKEDPSKT